MAACTAQKPSGGPFTFDPCPVRDLADARRVAEAVIAGRAEEGHASQGGYRIDVENRDEYWSVIDGPHVVEDGDKISVQAGGHSISFQMAKCTGAISSFEHHSWR
jgi:hypothetical protein